MLMQMEQMHAGLLRFIADLPCIWEHFSKPLG